MNSIPNLEWLQAQKAEIEAELAAVDRLIARAKLASNGSSHNAEAKPRGPRRPVNKRGVRHAFKPDPNSTASRTLAETRKILEPVSGHALPFANVIQRLPRDLVSSSKQRQNVRQAIQRSGKRAGIEYVDANCVRLVT